MSIMSKIKGVELVDDTGANLVVVKRIQSFEQRSAELTTKLQSLAADLSKAEAERDQMAFEVEVNDAPEKDFQKAAVRVETLKGEINRARLAVKANLKGLAAAKDELERLGRADLVRQVKRLCTARAKATDQIAEALAAYAKAYEALERNNRKLVGLLSSKHELGGLVVRPTEAAIAVEHELARVSGWQPLSKDSSPLPGQRTALIGNPGKFTPLADAVKEANVVLVKRVEDGPKRIEAPSIAPEPISEPSSEPANDQSNGVVVDGRKVVRAARQLDMGGGTDE